MKTPIDELLDEVRLLWHVLNRSGQRLHAGERVTLGMRAVLETVALDGPATVPQIARGRRVTRQHIQALVDALLASGLVALEDNPAHRRSALVRLTGAGRRTIGRMQRRERRYLDALSRGRQGPRLRGAAATLRAVRTALESSR